jgi:magnesium chelatase subunit I
MRQEARGASVGDVQVTVPDYLEQVIATFSQMARSSNQVNQRSGVSVRLSVSNLEVLNANALRRGLRAGEHVVVRGSAISMPSPRPPAARSRSSRSTRGVTA